MRRCVGAGLALAATIACAPPLAQAQAREDTRSSEAGGALHREAPRHVIALEVPGYAPAAAVPASGSEARPVVVALHGNFDRPEWMCAAWDRVIRGRAFLLCPRGVPREDAPGQDRWALPPTHRLTREIATARRALVARYGARVADGPDVYVGFSQGAHRLSRMAAARPTDYPRIQLVEGGNSMWRAVGARSYATSAGRVALVCAMRWCEQRGAALARILQAGDAAVQRERIPAAHHDLVAMEPALIRTFDWLVADDPRFTPDRDR